MTVSSQSKWDKFSRFAIGIGGAVDLFAGLALLFIPVSVAHLVDVPVPEDIYYIRLFGITAFSLGALFIIAAWDPKRYAAVIYMSAVMRFSAAALLSISLAIETTPPGFLKFLFVEGPITLIHISYAISLSRALSRVPGAVGVKVVAASTVTQPIA